ncbi:AAA family ATPase [Nafulsella turpanensis]|uniref:AAA family ATPase n=1 Tax=Nafulsella turpanensis TaxID=1265690 RepID=UPI000344A67D|nr:AAA family ATPase [Nafulsella turpanensis]
MNKPISEQESNPLHDPRKLNAYFQELLQNNSKANECKGLFTVKPANAWIDSARKRPIPRMLFGEFWFEGELCILFADTNLGKSILAVQIANSISRGLGIGGFKLEAQKQAVLYFDFELSDKQFENRYSVNFEVHYVWDDKFFRVEINPDAEIPDKQSFEDYLNSSLERAIVETGAKVLVIDNLTYLKNETERAKDALPLMKHLKALKSKYGLSIMALAHTPKRDSSKPLTGNDLQGSRMLLNFCDSCFAIGASRQDSHLRYIKQIKQRNTEQIYGDDNVCLCQIEKPHNFLQFSFIGCVAEWDHLKQSSEGDKEKRNAEVLELHRQGISNVDIAKRYGVSEGAVRKWLKKAEAVEDEKTK